MLGLGRLLGETVGFCYLDWAYNVELVSNFGRIVEKRPILDFATGLAIKCGDVEKCVGKWRIGRDLLGEKVKVMGEGPGGGR